MNRLWLISGSIFLFFLVLFGVFMALGLNMEEIAGELSNRTLPVAAVLAVILLIADVFLPIPSSLIMIANGALFGIWGGGILSLIGGTGASLTGYGIGRAGGKAAKRLLKPGDQERGERFFTRWGALSVIISRPLPLFSETVAVVAGICRMRPLPMLVSSIAGNLPAAILYAWAGANLQKDPLGLIPLAAVLGIAVLFFVVGKWVQPAQKNQI